MVCEHAGIPSGDRLTGHDVPVSRGAVFLRFSPAMREHAASATGSDSERE